MLVLKDVDQRVIQALKQRAKRLGITLEAAAVRALSRPAENLERTREEGSFDGEFETFLVGEADLDGPSLDTMDAASDEHEPRSGEASASPEEIEPTLEERQTALADAYPDEYVVLLGEQIIAHTVDKEEAYARYEAAFDFIGVGGAKPLIIAPGAMRKLGPPVSRGRAMAPKGSARR